MENVNQKCTIAVVIPAFNSETTIDRTLESISRQTVQPDEVIVVDDASTDGTTSALRSSPVPTRIIHRTSSGPGGYAARNLGVYEAKSDWVAFLDADDTWEPTHIQELRCLITQYPTSSFVSTGWTIDYNNERRTDDFTKSHSIAKSNRDCLSARDYVVSCAHGQTVVWTGAIAVKRSLLTKVGGFPEATAFRGGDSATWLNCVLEEGAIVRSYAVTAVYFRGTPNSVSKRSSNVRWPHPITTSVLDNLAHARAVGCSVALKRLSNRKVIRWARFLKRYHSLRNRLFLSQLFFPEFDTYVATWTILLLLVPSTFFTPVERLLRRLS